MIRCNLLRCNSKLDYNSRMQYEYAANMLVCQEKLGFSFFESRLIMSSTRNEKFEKIYAEFGREYDYDSACKLYWELMDRKEDSDETLWYAGENRVVCSDTGVSEKEVF